MSWILPSCCLYLCSFSLWHVLRAEKGIIINLHPLAKQWLHTATQLCLCEALHRKYNAMVTVLNVKGLKMFGKQLPLVLCIRHLFQHLLMVSLICSINSKSRTRDFKKTCLRLVNNSRRWRRRQPRHVSSFLGLLREKKGGLNLCLWAKLARLER